MKPNRTPSVTRRGFLAGACSLALPAMITDRAALGQAAATPVRTDAGLSRIVKEHAQKAKLPAAYLAVMFKRQYYGAVTGRLKQDADRPATEQDRFRVGSITKPMTSTLVLILARDGTLALDRPISTYLRTGETALHPEFKSVTVRHLLAHAGGMPGPGIGHSARKAGESDEAWAVRNRLEDALYYLSRPPSQPVGQILYSNNGFSALGAIAEAAAGVPYERLMQARVFGPLGMSRSGIGMPASKGMLTDPWYYPVKDGQDTSPIEPCAENDQGPGAAPNGGGFTTIHDACRLMEVHAEWYMGQQRSGMTGTLLQALKETRYGKDRNLAWYLGRDQQAGVMLMHGGQNADHRGAWNASQAWILPEIGVGILAATTKGTNMKVVNDMCVDALNYIKQG